MVLNEEVHRPILTKDLYYQRRYGATKLTMEFPAIT